MGRTQKLIAMMIRDELFANYIRENWLCLYNDILETHFTRWSNLDELSGMAIWDWVERNEVK